jgi:hypothetical protein
MLCGIKRFSLSQVLAHAGPHNPRSLLGCNPKHAMGAGAFNMLGIKDHLSVDELRTFPDIAAGEARTSM